MSGALKLNVGRMLRRSLVHRRARSFSALVALTVSAGVATALLTLYADLDPKLHKEFRSFGANIVVTGTLPGTALETVQQAAAVRTRWWRPSGMPSRQRTGERR